MVKESDNQSEKHPKKEPPKRFDLIWEREMRKLADEAKKCVLDM